MLFYFYSIVALYNLTLKGKCMTDFETVNCKICFFFCRLTESLKKRILSAYNLERKAPIQWGITHEKVGVAEYCKAGAVTVLQTGKFCVIVLYHKMGTTFVLYVM